MKVVIVGGVAGGASAAARIRRLDEHAQIIVIERSGYVSYANCGLPYYVGGVIKEPEELTLQTPESFWDRFRIDVRVRQEVTAINPAERKPSPSVYWTAGRSIRKPMINYSSHPAQSRRFLRFPASAVSAFSRCAQWRTPSASGALLRSRSRKLLFWLAVALSVWKWRKTLA